MRKKKGVKKRPGRFWQSNLSARHNQDIQRSYEEAAMKKVVSVLCRRLSANADKGKRSLLTRHVIPPGWSPFGRFPDESASVSGGIWVRLESDWKENIAGGQQAKQRSIFTGKGQRVKVGNK